MSVPGIVQSHLNGEQVAARVALGGEDALFVTPSRTLIYRSDGLLSDESVEEYPHGAERIELSEGRRKSKIQLDYGLDGTRKFSVPSSRLEEALHPVLAGVLNGAGVTDAGETIKQTYRFSELTLVVTSARVVKHIGAAVWDQEFEEYHYEDVTGLEVEEGSVASQIVIESNGRPQRIKTPNEETRHVHENLTDALVAYHDVGSYAEFEATVGATDESEDEQETSSTVSFGSGVDPIDANPPEMDVDTADESQSKSQADQQAEPAAEMRAETSAETRTEAKAQPQTDALDEPAPGEPTSDEPASEEPAVDDAEPAAPTAGADGDAGSEQSERAAKATESTSSDDGFENSSFESASSTLPENDTAAELAELTRVVERQNELLAEQQETIQQLVDRLNRGQ